MAGLTRCFWFDSLAEFLGINGGDLLADGTGVKFDVGDVVFIYTSTSLNIYIMDRYEMGFISDPPFYLAGPTDPGTPAVTEEGEAHPAIPSEGTSVWGLINISYTTSLIQIATNAHDPCSESLSAFYRCEFAHVLTEDPQALFCSELEIIPTDSVLAEVLLNDQTETDWVEESGAPLEWTAEGLKFDEENDPLTPIYQVGTPALPSATLAQYPFPGVRTSPRHFIGGNNGQPLRMYELTDTGGATLHHSITPVAGVPQEFGGAPNYSLQPVFGEKFVFADSDFSGKRASQGRLIHFEINASYQFVNELTIDTPNEIRNGYFGRDGVAMVVVDDTVHGVDTHIISAQLENLYVMRASNNYVGAKQTITLAAGTTVYALSGGRNYFLLSMFTGTIYYYRIYRYANDVWYQANQISRSGGNQTWRAGGFISDNHFLIDTHESSTAAYYRCHVVGTTDTASYLGSIYRGSGYPTGGTTEASRVYGTHYVCTISHAAPDTTIHLFYLPYIGEPWDIDVVDLGPFVDQWGDLPHGCWAVEDSIDPEWKHVFGSGYTTGPIGYYAQGHFHTSLVYSTGSYFVASKNASAIVLPESAADLVGGAIFAEFPTGTSLRFALSVNNGTSWITYSGGANVPISSLSDVVINGADYTNFGASLALIDTEAYRTIYVAFGLIRPESVVSYHTMVVTKYEYEYNSAAVHRRHKCLPNNTAYLQNDIAPLDEVKVLNIVEPLCFLNPGTKL